MNGRHCAPHLLDGQHLRWLLDQALTLVRAARRQSVDNRAANDFWRGASEFSKSTGAGGRSSSTFTEPSGGK
jgi:hypothetical protein